jgi:lysophospholipase L1-like esterase
MELEDIEIHNAVPVYHAAQGGWELPRYPRVVREAINPTARTVSGKTTGVEARFVVDGPDACLTVRSIGEDARVAIRRGSFFITRHTIPAGTTRRIQLRKAESFHEVAPSVLGAGGWSTDVWRVIFEGQEVILQDIDPLGWAIRPPKAGEKPSLRWLAYGSSITHSDHMGYPLVAAQMLNADVINKGLSGSCHIEREIADWFSTLLFDFATLELGINMRHAFEPSVFEERARYLITRLRKTHPEAPLLLITHFLNRDHHRIAGETLAGNRQAAYDEILRKLAGESKDPHLHLVEGTEILTDFHLLAGDMIHPTQEGNAQMAANLADRIRSIPGLGIDPA